MASVSSSSSFTYDVFLNFRGDDTRNGFIGHLYNELQKRKIHTFFDEKIRTGSKITSELIQKIQDSRIAITVLSIDYASSSFCLDELKEIVDCFRNKGVLIFPEFYMVDPSHVRKQEGTYREALDKHVKNLKRPDIIEQWKAALTEVANLSGFHLKERGGYEYKYIEDIVAKVSVTIGRIPLYVADHPVGLKSRVAEVMELLDVRSDDDGVSWHMDDGSNKVVHVVGIYGMGGVGKSTLARAVYNKLIDSSKVHEFETPPKHPTFDGICFLGNVREESNKNGLKHLQSTLLLEILGEKEINLASVEKGASMIKQRLQGMKVLLIFDDVDKTQQLQTIVGRPDWFGPGSRVIVTTRDKQLLAAHEVKRTYEVKEMNQNEAFKFLTLKAFRKELPDPTYEEVLNQVVTYTSGLPLASEVIGSNLFGKDIKEWKSAIKHLKRIPNNQILEILKVSFDVLGEEEKNVFLDIACCLKGYKLTEAEDILHALYDNCMKYHIGVLVEKSLIKISHDRVTLHDLIEEMGKDIDRQKSPKEPGERRRLWISKDIIQVLKDNMGTHGIEILCLDFSISDREVTVEWDGNAFEGMKNLKILIVRNVKFSRAPNYLPESLKVLEWQAQILS